MPIGDQTMLENYKKHVAERAKQNIPPLPLDADQTSELIELLKKDHQESDFLLNLLKAEPNFFCNLKLNSIF